MVFVLSWVYYQKVLSALFTLGMTSTFKICLSISIFKHILGYFFKKLKVKEIVGGLMNGNRWKPKWCAGMSHETKVCRQGWESKQQEM